jgi:hypothetical protein
MYEGTAYKGNLRFEVKLNQGQRDVTQPWYISGIFSD